MGPRLEGKPWSDAGSAQGPGAAASRPRPRAWRKPGRSLGLYSWTVCLSLRVGATSPQQAALLHVVAWGLGVPRALALGLQLVEVGGGHGAGWVLCKACFPGFVGRTSPVATPTAGSRNPEIPAAPPITRDGDAGQSFLWPWGGPIWAADTAASARDCAVGVWPVTLSTKPSTLRTCHVRVRPAGLVAVALGSVAADRGDGGLEWTQRSPPWPGHAGCGLEPSPVPVLPSLGRNTGEPRAVPASPQGKAWSWRGCLGIPSSREKPGRTACVPLPPLETVPFAQPWPRLPPTSCRPRSPPEVQPASIIEAA